MDFDIVNKTFCLAAKRNSGKSQLMRYIIMMSKHHFKKIFVICPTEQINRFYQGLVDEKNIFESYIIYILTFKYYIYLLNTIYIITISS
jgi:hypothetical protein